LRDKDCLIDPWGHGYEYRFPGEHGDFDLFSFGADGKLGGEENDQDIMNW
jgi:general secretion pathway protein G